MHLSLVAVIADSAPGAREGILVPARFPNGGIRLFTVKEFHVRKPRAAQRLCRRFGVGPPIDEGANIVGGVARPRTHALSIRHWSHSLSCRTTLPLSNFALAVPLCVTKRQDRCTRARLVVAIVHSSDIRV